MTDKKPVPIWLDVSEDGEQRTNSALVGCYDCPTFRQVYHSQKEANTAGRRHAIAFHKISWVDMDYLSDLPYDRMRE